jgi:hypothetical protein
VDAARLLLLMRSHESCWVFSRAPRTDIREGIRSMLVDEIMEGKTNMAWL